MVGGRWQVGEEQVLCVRCQVSEDDAVRLESRFEIRSESCCAPPRARHRVRISDHLHPGQQTRPRLRVCHSSFAS